jgi:hypothetical protein
MSKSLKSLSLENFFSQLENLEAEEMTAMVEKQLNDDDLELFVRHLEDFYGIEDEEQLGMLAQIMVTGYLAAKAEMSGTQHIS